MDLLDSLRMMDGRIQPLDERAALRHLQGLSDEERKRDRRAFFRSIHGPLNHILLTDRGWLARFNGKPWPFPTLDQELYANFDELRRERGRTDREIGEFLTGIAPERLDAPLSYENYAEQKFTIRWDLRSFISLTTKPIIADN